MMSSLFKSKKGSDSKSSSSKISTESESKARKQSASTTTPSSLTKSGAPSSSSSSSSSHGASVSPSSPSSALSSGGATASKVKPNWTKERSASISIDVSQLQDADYPFDARIKTSTLHGNSNTLSISRSGRYKAKGKSRPALFSSEADDMSRSQGAESHDSAAAAAASPRMAHTLSTPEDRQTVLDAVAARRTAAAAATMPISPSNWSTTANSTDL